MKTIKAKVHRLPFIEEWKPVIGYEGRYEVSNYGKVKSLARKVDRDYRPYSTKEKLLKTYIDSYGKLCVGLTKNGKTKQYSVYRLVAIAFIPNPKNKREVNHIDFDKSNACIQNLEWTTPTENRLHSYHQRNKHQGLTNNSNLYITTDEEIKEGDWAYDGLNNCIEQVDKSTVDMINAGMLHNNNRKIIATTDPKLNEVNDKNKVDESWFRPFIPKIPQSFIEEYCKAGGIDEVLVEVERWYLSSMGGTWKCLGVHAGRVKDWLQPKLNPDNTIIIHPVEEKMYSREEVLTAFVAGFKACEDGNSDTAFFIQDLGNKWIEENL